MNQTIEQHVQVSFNYPVEFTQHLFSPSNPTFKNILDRAGRGTEHKFLCVIDQEVAFHHPTLTSQIQDYAKTHHLILATAPIVVPGGEQSKNDISLVKQIQDAVHEQRIDRHSFIVVIGGGAVIDMAGYAAATAHRGVRLVRVPTTVLAQNDAAVGVKNSINAYGKKNFIGTFTPPFAVINDVEFLRTLQQRDWISGVSEAIKVALLKDKAFFEYIENHAEQLANRDVEPMQHVIYRCAELHLNHIATSGDAFELGSARPLDFGHWAAHRLEHLSQYRVRHGEAVALGIVLDSLYANKMNLLSDEDTQRIVTVFKRLGFQLTIPEVDLRDESGERVIMHGLDEFREHLGGCLTITLVDKIGHGFEVHEIDRDVMSASIDQLQTL